MHEPTRTPALSQLGTRFEHLKPLSKYSRMAQGCSGITSDQETSNQLHQLIDFSKPLINFNCKSHETSQDEGYDSPEKSSGSGHEDDSGVSSPGSLSLDVESIDSDVENIGNISSPLCKSLVCHSGAVKVTEDVQAGVIEPVRECQATLADKEAALKQHTSDKTTAPHKVKVKSVVVVSNKQKAELTTSRPVIFDRNKDWEHEKRQYVHTVTMHMTEKPGAEQGVMTELLNLMTHVADQTSDANGKQWQHPSDLTRRNYQRRFGNMEPKMTLCEWQAKSKATYKRFSKVPKIFERSPFP